jgi:5-methylthioadenosine/S-adenosylhomocysteine deaminase
VTSLLLRGGLVLSLNPAGDIFAPGYIAIDSGRIQAVGAGEPTPELAAGAESTWDTAGHLILPGLVNAHTHLGQVFVRNLGQDRPLLEWLDRVIWPAQQAMSPAEAGLAARVGLIENLRGGVTTVIDHQKLVATPAHSDAVAEAAEELGVRFVLARAWAETGRGAEDLKTMLAELDRLRRAWHGAADGRLRVAFGPLAPWRCSLESLRAGVEAARRWGLATHIHVAETQAEVDMTLASSGLRHVQYLDRADALGPDVQLVHAIWLSESEMDRVAESGAVVVHCPVSNAYLGSGIAPVRAWQRRGVPIALGTDGPGSNNSQDLFETMKLAALLAKATALDPAALSARDVLRMATAGGAQASGWRDTGQVAPGYRADLALIGLDSPRLTPLSSPAAALVYAASAANVSGVIVEGRVLMRDGKLTGVDEAALLEECRAAAAQLARRLP